MKKVITLVLAAVLALSVAVPVFAAESPVAPIAAPDKTAALPVVVASLDDCVFYSVFDADNLPEEVREEFISAQESLKEAAPEDMTVKFFFYHMHLNGETHDELCQDTFDIGKFEEIIVKQYVDKEWVELVELGKQMDEAKQVTVNSDGTITVTGLDAGPVAFFTK